MANTTGLTSINYCMLCNQIKMINPLLVMIPLLFYFNSLKMNRSLYIIFTGVCSLNIAYVMKLKSKFNFNS